MLVRILYSGVHEVQAPIKDLDQKHSKLKRSVKIWLHFKGFHINLFILYFAWIPQLHNLCTRSPQEEGNKICLIAIIGFACHTYNIDIIMYNVCIADKGRRLEVKNITCHGILWFIDFFLVEVVSHLDPQ